MINSDKLRSTRTKQQMAYADIRMAWYKYTYIKFNNNKCIALYSSEKRIDVISTYDLINLN